MRIIRLFFYVGSLALAAASCLWAQAPNSALGLVAKSQHGHIGNTAVSEGSTVYSGDDLGTDDNGSLLVRIGHLSLELQGSSSVHIYSAPTALSLN